MWKTILEAILHSNNKKINFLRYCQKKKDKSLPFYESFLFVGYFRSSSKILQFQKKIIKMEKRESYYIWIIIV